MTPAPTNENYGNRLIEIYDLMYASRPDVETLPGFCGNMHPTANSVLEFGIGTGRLAVPLAQAGYRVTGIDTSDSMLSALQQRANGLSINPVLADFRELPFDDKFDLVVILTNTLLMLDDVKEQRRTLQQAAQHLAADGLVVVETYDPQVYLERPSPFSVTLPLNQSTLITDTVIVDRLAQRVTQVHAITRPSRIDTVIEHSNWLTPRELDMLAESVGLELTGRYSDFELNPITSETRNFISVYAFNGSEQ